MSPSALPFLWFEALSFPWVEVGNWRPLKGRLVLLKSTFVVLEVVVAPISSTLFLSIGFETKVVVSNGLNVGGAVIGTLRRGLRGRFELSEVRWGFESKSKRAQGG